MRIVASFLTTEAAETAALREFGEENHDYYIVIGCSDLRTVWIVYYQRLIVMSHKSLQIINLYCRNMAANLSALLTWFPGVFKNGGRRLFWSMKCTKKARISWIGRSDGAHVWLFVVVELDSYVLHSLSLKVKLLCSRIGGNLSTKVVEMLWLSITVHSLHRKRIQS